MIGFFLSSASGSGRGTLPPNSLVARRSHLKLFLMKNKDTE
jgi:hypothetical protein